MDKLIYVAMSGATQTLDAQAANSYNLANASTSGFKADLTAFQTRAVTGPGYPSRAYATNGSVGWDTSNGVLVTTGNPLDVAVQGSGFIAVQDANGNEAYTRAGDLHVDPNGLLMTATGHQVIGEDGPITIPPAATTTIGADGSVSIVPMGQTPLSIAKVGRIKLVNPPPAAVQKGLDGLYRMSDGSTPPADAGTTLASGVLESSNVNLPSCLVNMIELARQFELQIKSLHTAEDDSASSSKLLQSS
ncbi:MAG TPA: flagellar basal body rod protein FlgF [Steroidobacteraceae bacterium]|nr:flagellar basal body rod protein FlgF [Steroidobacteraceae bacterium]